MATRPAKACLAKGYKFQFEGKRNWRRSSDDSWEIVARDEVCGKLLGHRNIDGVRVAVVGIEGQGMRGIYASQHSRKVSFDGKRR
jgi:hypothetical protein